MGSVMKNLFRNTAGSSSVELVFCLLVLLMPPPLPDVWSPWPTR